MKGQALIALLSFIIIAMTVISAAVIILITNILASGKVEQGTMAYSLAQSGGEDALLRLLRNPSYAGGQQTLPQGTITVSITGIAPGPYTIYSSGKVGSFVRRIKTTASYAGNTLTITEWKEL